MANRTLRGRPPSQRGNRRQSIDKVDVGDDPNDVQYLARHEAGHTVAAMEFRRAFKFVTIIPQGDGLGHVLFNPPPRHIVEDHLGGDGARAYRWAERNVLVSLAGPAAEREVVGKLNHIGAGSDYSSCVDMAIRFYDEETAGKWIDSLLARAQEFVRVPRNWVRIEGLAEALLVEMTMSARRAGEVASEAAQDKCKLREAELNYQFRREERQKKILAQIDRQRTAKVR